MNAPTSAWVNTYYVQGYIIRIYEAGIANWNRFGLELNARGESLHVPLVRYYGQDRHVWSHIKHDYDDPLSDATVYHSLISIDSFELNLMGHTHNAEGIDIRTHIRVCKIFVLHGTGSFYPRIIPRRQLSLAHQFCHIDPTSFADLDHEVMNADEVSAYSSKIRMNR